jgi:hypothetical protein
MIDRFAGLRDPEKLCLSGILVLAIGLFSYTSYRAAVLSFTYDESSTVLEYVSWPYEYIFNRAPTATNHVLNTALMKFTSSIFPPSEFIFRLPNLLGHLIYLTFSFLLVWSLRKQTVWFALIGFVLLNFNPYLLDFFSLARGYGLAAGFTMMAIHMFHRYHQSSSAVHLFGTLLAAGLAVLSNFSLLNLFLGIVGLNLLLSTGEMLLTFRPRQIFVELIVSTFFGAVIFWLIRPPVSELIARNELFFGGDTGVFTDTIRSLVERSTFSDNEIHHLIAGSVLVSMVVIMLANGLIGFVTTPLKHLSFGIKMLLLVSIILVGLELQHLLFNTRFIIERTALFLYPLIISGFVFSLSELKMSGYEVKRSFGIVLASIFMINVVSASNLSYYHDWKYERNTKQLMTDLGKEEQPYEVYFGVDWPYSVTFRFYSWLYEYSWLRVIENPISVPYHNNESASYPAKHLDLQFLDTHTFTSNWLRSERSIVMDDGMVLAFYPKPDHTEKTLRTEFTDKWSEVTTKDMVLYFDSASHFMNPDSTINIRVEVFLKPLKANGVKDLRLIAELNGTVISSRIAERGMDQNAAHRCVLYHRDKVDSLEGVLKIYISNGKGRSFSVSNYSLTTISLR